LEGDGEKEEGHPGRAAKEPSGKAKKGRLLLTQDDLLEVKSFYERIMAMAAVGLFYRTGRLIGARMWTRAKGDDMENVFRHLKRDGWLEALQVEGDHIDVAGSIEAGVGRGPCCHILRGILTEILEQARGSKVYCQETACAASGAEHCRFSVQFGAE
jgi:predicted hydrocarbon binding protein